MNPRTFYRHRKRIEEEGQWQPRSRRPKTSPGATPAAIVELIVRLRGELAPDNGADNIRAALETLAARQDWAAAGWRVPVRATINRILDRAGLLAKNPAKRPRSSWRRFSYARPRDCYQIDGTEHVLADGSKAVAIDVIDDCSRVWVASHVAAAETITAALAAMRAAIAEWGAPAMVLADNGSAFAHHNRAKDKTLTSEFSRTLAHDHHIRVIHSSPYHPQTCGKVERLHQTAAKLLHHYFPDPPATLAELQHRLDTVREHYNTRRRHGSLDTTPQACWHAAPTHGSPGDLPRQDDATVHLIHITTNGTATLGNHILSIGRRHADTTVTLLRNNGHVTAYTTDGDTIGTLTLDKTKRYQGKLTPTTQPHPPNHDTTPKT
ncbi:MAG TPA: DDE-type integrase/transposase/recombinase [Amycolatopsis sp.]|nr:DDE-type integrase/transposase/recombinase [Amycolatopsis sp.]